MGIASRQIGKFLRKQLDLFDDAPDATTEKSSVPKVKEEKDPQETITVFPKPQRMWEDKRLGGDYINPKTGDVLTDKQPLSANINVRSGKPKFTISNQNTDKIGSDSGYNVKVNLFKKSAGWRDADVPKGADSELNNLPSLVSVVSRGKHYYTTDVNFTKGVQLKKYPNKQDEPKLRPTVPKGNLDLGTIMGYVNVRGKKHPVYDSIKVYSSGGLSMNKQMELFEEGGQVDPVSGNDVPLGSTEEEVRDDQPAMLSEGEMVIPADVVRYFGVEHFMKLRDEAKIGYKKMEAMGQFGTEEGQTLPDDALFNAGGPPFTIEDIEVIEPDDLENLKGGEEAEIEAANGALVRNFAEGGSMIAPNMTSGMSISPSTAGTANTIPFGTTPLVPDTGREAKLSDSQGLGQLVGSTGVGAFSTKYFMDPTGTIHQIFSMEGLAQEEVPEDFIEIDSPFELRSYAELGGSVSKAAPSKKEEEEEEETGDGATGEYGGSAGDATSKSLGEIADIFGKDIAEFGKSFGQDLSDLADAIGGYDKDEVSDEDDIADINDPGFDNEATTAPDPTDPDDDDAAADAEAAAEAAANDAAADATDEAGIARGGLIKRKPRSKKRGGRKKNKRGGLGSRK